MLYFFLLQGSKEKRPKVLYDRTNLRRAFDATRSGMSVYMAARHYNVPESTLRDRTRGNISVDATIGFDTIFNRSEKRKLWITLLTWQTLATVTTSQVSSIWQVI